MAVHRAYKPEWQDYYLYHRLPFRDATQNVQGVQIGLNPNCRAADWDLSGQIIRPRRFNNLVGTIPTNMPGPGFPRETVQDLNYFNVGWWGGYAITPRHVVVCHHFITATEPSAKTLPDEPENPWPDDAKGFKTVVFMNAEGEYFVHPFEYADPKVDGVIPKSAQLGGDIGNFDAVLLVLDDPIPADSGIRIYDRVAIIDGDQQFSLSLNLDPMGRVKFNENAGFRSDVIMENDEFPQFQHAYSGQDGLAKMVEERKLPGGDLENEPIEYASTGMGNVNGPIQFADGPISTFSGDSGTQYFIHSKSKGTMAAMGPGGAYTCCTEGPWAKIRMDSFKAYLETFNAENGTDYTFDYEIVTDAITDLLVPPMIDPLVCRTQEGMLSKKLVCEITATGANGEIVTKRSESLLEQGITEPPIFGESEDTSIIDIQVNRTTDPDTFTNSFSQAGLIKTRFTQWLEVDFWDAHGGNLNMDPLTPMESGICTLTSSDGRQLIVNMARADISPWEPAGAGQGRRRSEAFFIPEDWPDSGDVIIEVSITTRNGTITTSRTVPILDQISPTFVSTEYTAPNDEFPTGNVRVNYTGSPAPDLTLVLFVTESSSVPSSGTVCGLKAGVVEGSNFVDIPIAYFNTPGSPIPCDPHLGQTIFLLGAIVNSSGQFVIGDFFGGVEPDIDAVVVTTIASENCST